MGVLTACAVAPIPVSRQESSRPNPTTAPSDSQSRSCTRILPSSLPPTVVAVSPVYETDPVGGPAGQQRDEPPGIVAVDEAYYAFADASFLPRVLEFPNLVVVRETQEQLPIPQRDIVSFGRLELVEGMSANDIIVTALFRELGLPYTSQRKRGTVPVRGQSLA